MTRMDWFTLIVIGALTVFYVAFAANRFETSHLYGDEPEYYFAGQSVWQDGDLELRDEFLDPDPAVFPGPLTFKIDPTSGEAARINFLPTNGVLFIGWVDLLTGPLGVLLLHAIMNLASLVLLLVVLMRLFGQLAATLTVGLVGFTVPLAWMAASVWTEIPALLCASAVLALAPQLTASRAARIGTAIALALLPWLHQKYGFLAVGLGLALLIDARRRKLWPWTLGAPLLAGIGTVAFSLIVQDRPNFTDSGSGVRGEPLRFFSHIFAWYFDQTRGYLPLAPIWLLTGVGVLVLLRQPAGRRLLTFLAVGFGPMYVIYFAGPFLGGDAPPGRETIPAVPALAILLGAGLWSLRGPIAIGVSAACAVPSLLIGTVAPFRFGQDIIFNNAGEAKLLTRLSDARWNLVEPWPRLTLDPGAWSRSRLLLALVTALAVVATIYLASSLWLARRREGDAGDWPSLERPLDALAGPLRRPAA